MVEAENIVVVLEMVIDASLAGMMAIDFPVHLKTVNE